MNSSASLRLCGVFLLLITLALTGSVEGHSSRKVKWEEMHVFGDRAVLFLRYDLSEPRFISDLRERFDFDATRSLNPDERNSLVEYVRMLATQDMHLRWDGQEISPVMTLKATSGLDRGLPSAYPIILYWQLDFLFPAAADTFGETVRHEISFEDREARWHSPFTCSVRLVPRVEESVSKGKQQPRSFEFPSGSGSFRLTIYDRRITIDE
jgi:hypothetical protein